MSSETELKNTIDRLGLVDAYRNDPIVYNAFQLLRRGMSLEDILVLAVRTLSECNDRLQKDMVAIASSSPMVIDSFQKKEASGEQ